MCAPLSIYDDSPDDPEATAVIEALVAAESKRLRMALLIAGGATRYHFPRHDADTAILETVGAVTTARYNLDKLVISRVMGERCVFAPTPQLQGIELQRRVTKNEAARGLDKLSPALAAAHPVDTADASLIAAAHNRGASLLADLPPVRTPTRDSYQGGFGSLAGA